MKTRIAILAALPREIAPLIRDWPVRIESRRDGTLIAECDKAIAVCAGMGRERVEYAAALAERQGSLSAIFSVGYAGAVRDGILRNTIYWPETVIDAESGERHSCDGGSGTLVTVGHVLERGEKREMAERWDADLVDMEAATVARLAQMRGVPFRTLKAVSDEVSDELPDLNSFIDARGAFRQAAFAFHLTSHPSMIPSAIRLGRNASRASQALSYALREVLEHAE